MTRLEIRTQALELYCNGLSSIQIERKLGVNRQTILRWVKTYKPEELRKASYYHKLKEILSGDCPKPSSFNKKEPLTPPVSDGFIAPLPLARLMGTRA